MFFASDAVAPRRGIDALKSVVGWSDDASIDPIGSSVEEVVADTVRAVEALEQTSTATCSRAGRKHSVVQAVARGTRQLLEASTAQGCRIENIETDSPLGEALQIARSECLSVLSIALMPSNIRADAVDADVWEDFEDLAKEDLMDWLIDFAEHTPMNTRCISQSTASHSSLSSSLRDVTYTSPSSRTSLDRVKVDNLLGACFEQQLHQKDFEDRLSVDTPSTRASLSSFDSFGHSTPSSSASLPSPPRSFMSGLQFFSQAPAVQEQPDEEAWEDEFLALCALED